MADPNVDAGSIEKARRQINRLADEIARLSETEMAPAEYYGEFLQRVLTALAAPAGAVWLRTPQGNLQLQYQINMRQVGLDQNENVRAQMGELLRQAATKGQPALVAPHSSVGEPEAGSNVAPGNATDFVVLLAPIMVDKTTAGLVQVWQDPNRPADAQRGFLQFLIKMAGFASGYARNTHLRQMVGQQQVWTQLETFSRQIHGSLNPNEVSYLVANEGRRLVEVDRISIAIREGYKAHVKAVSGADTVERRSNLVQRMTKLFTEVLNWGERLVYDGTIDESLPPRVLEALDNYLEESNSKLLVVMPLKDEREAESKRPCRSVLMMESFEPAASSEQIIARLEVVARHATSALYNAAEHRRIPGRFIWGPLAKLQDGLGGKTRMILTLVGIGIVVLVAAMVFVPYPLKMEAFGHLQPKVRHTIYPPFEGRIIEIKENLKSGTRVVKGQELILMEIPVLAEKIDQMEASITEADHKIRFYSRTPVQQRNASAKIELERAKLQKKEFETRLHDLLARHGATRQDRGKIWLRAPITGIVLTSEFRAELLNRNVQRNEPLIRIGATSTKPRVREWEIELKIPQKHAGQILRAYKTHAADDELWVDFLLSSSPTQTFKGKLTRTNIAYEANPDNQNPNQPEPILIARVRVSSKRSDIPEGYRLTPELLVTGTEVRSRVRCGNRAMGYSLFYGVHEFIRETLFKLF